MAEKRDPRAHWLDEDPFDQMDTKSKTHTRARDDGNWRKPHIRVVNGNSSGHPFFRVFCRGPFIGHLLFGISTLGVSRS